MTKEIEKEKIEKIMKKINNMKKEEVLIWYKEEYIKDCYPYGPQVYFHVLNNEYKYRIISERFFGEEVKLKKEVISLIEKYNKEINEGKIINKNFLLEYIIFTLKFMKVI